jgi:hypothetical protein
VVDYNTNFCHLSSYVNSAGGIFGNSGSLCTIKVNLMGNLRSTVGGASGIGLGIAGALARRSIAVTLGDIDTLALEALLARRS